MTFELERLIASAAGEVARNACAHGEHNWTSEGGRACPMGAEGCSQTVYVCRSCGAHDHGDHADSPAKVECRSACGDSMMGWRNGPFDPEPE